MTSYRRCTVRPASYGSAALAQVGDQVGGLHSPLGATHAPHRQTTLNLPTGKRSGTWIVLHGPASELVTLEVTTSRMERIFLIFQSFTPSQESHEATEDVRKVLNTLNQLRDRCNFRWADVHHSSPTLILISLANFRSIQEWEQVPTGPRDAASSRRQTKSAVAGFLRNQTSGHFRTGMSSSPNP